MKAGRIVFLAVPAAAGILVVIFCRTILMWLQNLRVSVWMAGLDSRVRFGAQVRQGCNSVS